MKKILVTGAGGFVGSRVMQQWAGHYELCTFPKGFLATAGEDAVRQAVLQQRPDVILHTAAISDTGYCAGHPEQAYRANVELSVWLARAAAEIGAKLVAFSSDQVYAGVEQSGPLPETIPLKPANVYGQGKLEMEQRQQVARYNAQRRTTSPSRRCQQDSAIGIVRVQVARAGDSNAEQFVRDIIADEQPMPEGRFRSKALCQCTAHQQIPRIGD